MNQKQKHYYAFISHSSKDEKFALWLRNKLVNYNIPAKIQLEKNAPKHLRPIFLYQTDLASDSVLTHALDIELHDSQYLIVICSPDGAKSKFVNDEIRHFIDSGREENIIPVIIGGVPHATNSEEECFPPSLLELSQAGVELRGVDFPRISALLGNKMAAVANIVATMLGVKFDALWDIYKNKERRKKITICIVCAIIALLLLFLGNFIREAYTTKFEKKIIDNSIMNQGYYTGRDSVMNYYRHKFWIKETQRWHLSELIHAVDNYYYFDPIPIVYQYTFPGNTDISRIDFASNDSILLIAANMNYSGWLNMAKQKLEPIPYTNFVAFMHHTGGYLSSIGNDVSVHDAKGTSFSIELDEKWVETIQLSPDEEKIATYDSYSKKVALYTTQKADQRKVKMELDSTISMIAYNQQGDSMIIATEGNKLYYYHIWENAPHDTLQLPVPAIAGIHCGSEYYLALQYEDSIRIVSDADLSHVLFAIPSNTILLNRKAKFAYNRDHYLFFSSGKYLVLYDMAKKVNYLRDMEPFGGVKDIVMSPSGHHFALAIGSTIGIYYIKDNFVSPLTIVPDFNKPEYWSNASVSPKDSLLAIAVVDSVMVTTVKYYNYFSGERYRHLQDYSIPEKKRVRQMLVIPDTKKIVLEVLDSIGDTDWQIVDMRTGECTSHLLPDDKRYGTMQLCSNGYLRWKDDDLFDISKPYYMWKTDSSMQRFSFMIHEVPLLNGICKFSSEDYAVHNIWDDSIIMKDRYGKWNRPDALFDGDYMVYVDGFKELVVFNTVIQKEIRYDISKYVKNIEQRQDVKDYCLKDYKHGFVILTKGNVILIIDTETGDLIYKQLMAFNNDREGVLYKILDVAILDNAPIAIITHNGIGCIVQPLRRTKDIIKDWESSSNR